MADLGTFEKLLVELGKVLLPLRLATSSPGQFGAFMAKLGWQVDDVPQPIQDIGDGIDNLFTKLRAIVGDRLSFDGSVALESSDVSFSVNDISDLAQSVEQIIGGIRDIANAPDAAFPASLVADNFKQEFPGQLITFLLTNYLSRFQPTAAFALRALGIIKTRYVPPTGNRVPFVHYELDFSDIPRSLGNPVVVFENAFGWGSSGART